MSVPNFAGLYAKKERVNGRELVVVDDKVPGGGVSFRLYDVLTGKDLSRRNSRKTASYYIPRTRTWPASSIRKVR